MPSSSNYGAIENQKRKLIFVNRFYAPDMSATSQILTDLAEFLVEESFTVVVYASRTNLTSVERYASDETLNSVQVRRVWSTNFGRKTALRRLLDYASFYLSVFVSLLVNVKRGEVIIAKTDPPMLSVPIGLIARIKKAKTVNWLQDVFPEVSQKLGIGPSRGIILSLIKQIRNRSLRRADFNVVIGSLMARKLVELGVASRRIHVIENFADDVAIKISAEHSPHMRATWGIGADDFIVGYSGNLGRAHDIDTILDVAALIKHDSSVKFLFVGSGFLHQKLRNEIKERRLTNVIIQDYQPRSRLAESLALPNLHWASLKPELEGYIVPSKIYGIAAAGRPLLMIGAPEGEIGEIFREFAFGTCVSPGNAYEAAQFILNLKENSPVAKEMGSEARRFIESRASKARSLQRWCGVFQELA